MILTDNETRVDLLNNEAIAKTIIALLREQPARPITIGVHGDWGAGKSSILEMIEAGLDGKDDTRRTVSPPSRTSHAEIGTRSCRSRRNAPSIY